MFFVRRALLRGLTHLIGGQGGEKLRFAFMNLRSCWKWIQRFIEVDDAYCGAIALEVPDSHWMRLALCVPKQVSELCIPVQDNGHCVHAQGSGCSYPRKVNGLYVQSQWVPAQVNATFMQKSMGTASLCCIPAQVNGCCIPAHDNGCRIHDQVNGRCTWTQRMTHASSVKQASLTPVEEELLVHMRTSEQGAPRRCRTERKRGWNEDKRDRRRNKGREEERVQPVGWKKHRETLSLINTGCVKHCSPAQVCRCCVPKHILVTLRCRQMAQATSPADAGLFCTTCPA